jgi:putative sigma-54 modulation protein
MRVDVTGRHVEITPSLRNLIEKRLAKLERLLNDSMVSAQVILTKEKYRHRTEIVIHARGDHMMRGLGEGNAWPMSVRQAAQKVEQQAQTLKGKWAERKRSSTRRRFAARPHREWCAPAGTPSSRCRSKTRHCASTAGRKRSSSSATPKATP